MEHEVKITLRLPATLHQRLVEFARADRRSLNSEFIVLLEEAAAARARGQYQDQADR